MYEYKPYPRWKYHPDGRAVVVEDETENAALGLEWRNRPAEPDIQNDEETASAEPDIQDDEETASAEPDIQDDDEETADDGDSESPAATTLAARRTTPRPSRKSRKRR